MKTKTLFFTFLSLSMLVLGGCKGKTNSSSEDAHTHTWGAPTWTWNGYESATAHFVCTADSTHTHDEVASGSKISSEVTTPANCTSEGLETYTATVTFEGKNYSDSKTKTLSATGEHTLNQYGFCTSGGEYRGATVDTDVLDGIHTATQQIAHVNQNESAFFRFEAGAGHGYHIEDWDPWEWDDTKILSATKAYTLIDGAMVEYPLVVSIDNMEPLQLKDDNYLYIVFHASEAVDGVMLNLVESHIYNDAGVCERDGSFITSCNGDNGVVIPKGSEGKIGISYSDNGHITYYKIVEDIYPFEHHKFSVSLTNILQSEVELYYVDEHYAAHQLSIEEDNEEEVPAGVKTLYVAIAHTTTVSGGEFHLVRVEHSAAQHGYCPLCDLPLGTSLVYDTPSSSLQVKNGETLYLNFDLMDLWSSKIGSSFDLRLYCSMPVFDEESPIATAKFYIYEVYNGFTEVTFYYDDSYQCDMTIDNPGDAGYLFIEIANVSSSPFSAEFTVCPQS